MTSSADDFSSMVDAAAASQSGRPGVDLLQAWQGMDLVRIRQDLIARLQAAGIDEAENDTRFMLEHAFQPTPLAIVLADPAQVSWQRVATLADLAAHRLARMPLSQVLGDKPFWTLDLKVTRDVLTPRADTETLVETTLKAIPDRSAELTLADFGTGSGAILLALLAELPHAKGLGIDLSESALGIARENARRNALANRADFRAGSWADDIADDSLDIAVSNPPYIASAVIDTLEPEVRDHEPREALDGGEDGLDAYRHLLPEFFRVLRPGGLMAVEIGYDQGESVMGLARTAGFHVLRIVRDFGGQPRVVQGFKPDR